MTSKVNNYVLWIFLVALAIPCFGSNVSSLNFYLEEVRSLSELPLDKLIKIKSSFSKKNNDHFEPVLERRASSALSAPQAIPLRRSGHKPIRRYEEWEEKGKDSKISKIFQLTVTALSFLAFGGYLLTLIITAIRRNQSQQNPGNVIVLQNLQSLQKVKRPKRHFVIYDPIETDYNTERLYRGMIMLSSEYSRQYY